MYRALPSSFDEMMPFDDTSESASVVLPDPSGMGAQQNHISKRAAATRTVIHMRQDTDVANTIRMFSQFVQFYAKLGCN